MAYEKLSRRALGCMYTAEIIGDVIFIVLIGKLWIIVFSIKEGTAFWQSFHHISCSADLCGSLHAGRTLFPL